jgi:hypothetical protein
MVVCLNFLFLNLVKKRETKEKGKLKEMGKLKEKGECLT